MTNRICTVGHSTRDFGEMLEMLHNHGITCLADVRSFPSSRKFPQWNQPAIIGALPPDIGYRWIPKLGGRRHTPKSAPSANGAWQVKAFRDYADYMASDEFAEGLSELLELAEHERPAIMCSEAVPWRCHRRRGHHVAHHVQAGGPAQERAYPQRASHLPPSPARLAADMSIIDSIREAVTAIPAGAVASYGDIGERIGTGPRQVGRAMSLLGDSVPWWRVVHADGTPASCHDGRAHELLNDEGTPMRGASVDMKRARHRWDSQQTTALSHFRQ
jgi:alkylated DNA nucleotide flippase Atl1